MDKYEVIKPIGKGSHGEVFLVSSKEESTFGQHFVLKKILLKDTTQEYKNATKQEVDLLAKLRHPNIVQYRESFTLPDETLCIVMEYCENGDLYSQLQKYKQSGKYAPEKQILEWFIQITAALQYIHQRKVIHRDLKTQNLFLTKNNELKLGDFGIARILENESSLAQTMVGTPYYMSVEILSGKRYNHKTDIWALGCCLFEMASLRHAFNANEMPTLITKVIKGSIPSVPKDYSATLQELVRSLLNKDPKLRPSASAILKSSFIQKFIQINTPSQIPLVAIPSYTVKTTSVPPTYSNPLESPRKTTQNIPEKRGMVTPTRDKKIQIISNGVQGSGGNSKSKKISVKEKEIQAIPVSPIYSKIKKEEKTRRSSGTNISSKNTVNPLKQQSTSSRRQSNVPQLPIPLNLVAAVQTTSIVSSISTETSISTVLKTQDQKTMIPIENKENAKETNFQSIIEETSNPIIVDSDEFPVMQCITAESDSNIIFPVLESNAPIKSNIHVEESQTVDTNMIYNQELSVLVEEEEDENEELMGSGSLSKRISFIKNQCIAELGPSKFQKAYEFIKKNNDPVIMETPSFALRIRDILGVEHEDLVGKYSSLIQQLIMCEEAVQ